MERPYELSSTPEGIRFELPVRDLGDFAKFGFFIMAFFAVGAIMLLIWSCIWLTVGLGMLADAGWIGVPVAAISLVGFVGIFFAFKFGTLGFYLFCNKTRCVVEIDSMHVYSSEIFGPFKWRRKIKRKKIERIAVRRDANIEKHADKAKGLDLATIHVFGNEKDFLVAPGYPQQIMLTLITEMGEALNRERGDNPIDIDLEIKESTANWLQPDDGDSETFETEEKVYTQPADSKVEVYDYGGSDAFKVPPMGIWKGSKGMMGFSIAWNGFMLVFTTVFASIMVAGGNDNDIGWLGMGIFVPIILLFWTIGVCMLVAAINAGRRSAMIGVADGQLFVERKSIFGTKWLEWPVDQIDSIKVGPSGTEINDVPILELKIRDNRGKSHGMLSQLSNGDLQWIAQELNQSIT